MTTAVLRGAHIHTTDRSAGARSEALGMIVMRGGLGLIFLWFGAMKFTSYEATAIAPFIMNSPLIGWLHAALGLQGASDALGVVEILCGVLLLIGFANAKLSAIGGAIGTVTFLVTLSFLFTTPGVAEPLAGGFPALSAVPGQFLLKDLGLLGISIYVLGDAMARIGAGSGEPARTTTLHIGTLVLRYGLALIFLWFGAMKFTSYEATGIAPFVMNSPLVGWWHAQFGVQGTSYLLGAIEVSIGLLIAIGPVAPRAWVVGATMAVVTFVVTLSFLFSTPGVTAPMGFPALSADAGQFLLKDIGLLGISIWLLGEALRAAGARNASTRRATPT